MRNEEMIVGFTLFFVAAYLSCLLLPHQFSHAHVSMQHKSVAVAFWNVLLLPSKTRDMSEEKCCLCESGCLLAGFLFRLLCWTCYTFHVSSFASSNQFITSCSLM